MKDRRWGVYAPEIEDANQYDMVSALTISPDGKQLAYAAFLNGHWQVLVNNRASMSFDDFLGSRIEFSPDSLHFAFGARNEGENYIVINGEMGEPVGEPINGSRIHFDSNNSINTIFRNGNRYYRLKIEIQ